MAVDWVTGNVYWTDYQLEQIEVASPPNSDGANSDGTAYSRMVLFSANVTKPRAIVLDATKTLVWVYLFA